MSNDPPEILSVSELNRRSKRILEAQFPMIWVEGEISNFASPGSGHWYFSLKDNKAQVRCAMFRNRNIYQAAAPKNGDHVTVRARVSLYEGRGEFQLIIEHLEAAGEGALRQAFEKLKQQLLAEGLFNEEFKQDLPVFPQHIGVITSPTGAAIRDILTVFKRRFPAISVSIFPVAVQGEPAAAEIADAIEIANHYQHTLDEPLDALIVGRGGGSLEDLQAFNSELVARAIFHSEIPIVSAVGHEVDVTISDFVADARAATPSAAAEMLSPDQKEWLATFNSYETLLANLALQKMASQQQKLLWLRKRMRHPGSRLQEQAQRLDDLELHLCNAIHKRLLAERHRFSEQKAKLYQQSPRHRLEQAQQRTATLLLRIKRASQQKLVTLKQQLAGNAQLLESVSPLATVHRGYAIVMDQQQKIIRDAKQLRPGDKIQTHLANGRLDCTVDAISDNNFMEGK